MRERVEKEFWEMGMIEEVKIKNETDNYPNEHLFSSLLAIFLFFDSRAVLVETVRLAVCKELATTIFLVYSRLGWFCDIRDI